jgi:diguanylate cyclase (GGDEF)-like protein
VEYECIRILLVDDDEDDYVVTRDLLSEVREMRYELQWVSAYDLALEVIEKGNHDVYLFDYRLGGRNGLDLLREAVGHGCSAPVIMMTGQGEHEVDMEAMKAGAADYLVKNELDSHQLERAIRYAIERKRSEEKITSLAYYDSLTHLPNRLLFQDRLKQFVSRGERYSAVAAVMFLDLDDFKRVNDTLGHSGGDQLLKKFADRLRAILRKSDSIARRNIDDMCARLGGDEFTIFLTDIKGFEDAAKVAERIISSLSEPFMLDNREIHITTSIGIAVYPYDGKDLDTILKNADAAMYFAKNHGKNNYQYYKQSMNASALDRLALEHDLRKAIEQGELLLHYQPQVNAESGKIIGMEALIRWMHPEKGMVPPLDFIPLAEQTGLINPISDWVVETACRQANEWLKKGFSDIKVSVNLTSHQFQQKNFVATIAGILEKSGLKSKNLSLEITESTLMQNTEMTVITLHELARLGLEFTIDDFGTGYSSLSYLTQFPIRTIKIDRSFINGINTDQGKAAIVKAVISLAHSLEMNIIAEGVETEEQMAYLQKQGCNDIQGYLFSPPVPPEEMSKFLENEKEGESICSHVKSISPGQLNKIKN